MKEKPGQEDTPSWLSFVLPWLLPVYRVCQAQFILEAQGRALRAFRLIGDPSGNMEWFYGRD